VISLGTFTFGYSVDSRITVDKFQKLAGNAAQLTLEGYWIPVLVRGEGTVGCLYPHDEIEIRAGTQEDIDRIVAPRTSASPPTRSTPKDKLTPGTVESNYIGQQSGMDALVSWDTTPALLERGKFIHVLTDGGARPNPGSAGWGAIIHQNRKFAWTFGHCSRASNNAMELRAVIEALRNITDGMYVWISTDSCYVKKGVVECLRGWIAHNRKNSKGERVAIQSLWSTMLQEVSRMERVEWTWGKAHAEFLLNQCADILATKGVRNETPPANVQYLHAINEDTDRQEYVMTEAEQSPVPCNWVRDDPPPNPYIMTGSLDAVQCRRR
jgi:ribonuclease HI